MVQTRQEANARRARNAFASHSNRYESLRYTMYAIYDEALLERRNHAWILQQRDARIFPYRSGLPQWRIMQLEGAWDALADLHWRQLELCYAHPDTGVLTPVGVLLYAGFGSRLGEGVMCYKGTTEIFL